MNQHRSHIILTLLFFIALSPLVVLAKSNWDEEAKKRKAKYAYLEAIFQESVNQTAKQLDLINYSYKLDSTNSEVAFYKGLFDTYSLIPAQAEKGNRILKNHFEKEDKDYYLNVLYCARIVEEQNKSYDEILKTCETLKSRYPDKIDVQSLYALALSEGDSIQKLKAIDEYNNIEAFYGKTANISEKKMSIYHKLNDTKKVAEELDDLIKSDTTNISNILFAGNIYLYSLNDSIRALSYYNKAYELDSSSELAISTRINYFIMTNDSIALQNDVINAIKNPDVSVESKISLLSYLIGQFNYDPTKMSKIREYYSLLTATHPNDDDAHVASAAIHMYYKDYYAAAKDFSTAIELNPSKESHWANYINAYTFAEDKKKTFKTINKANDLFPNSNQIKYITGVSYQSFGQNDKAIDYYKSVISSSDSIYYELVYCSLGDIYGEEEMFDSAYYFYEKSLEINPANDNTLNNYAYFLAINNTELDKAELLSSLTIADSTKISATYLDTYAWIKFLKKEYSIAKEIIDFALEIEGESNAEMLHHAGDIYFMCGDSDKALYFWNKALAIIPDDKLLQKKVKYKTFFDK